MLNNKEAIKVGGVFCIKCFSCDGKLLWKKVAKNRVVNVGLQHILDVLFSGATQVNPWYLGLIDNTSSVNLVAADTLSSHAAWTENTNYTGDRKEYVEVRSAQTMSNTASKASFTITVNSQTISGAFLCSVATGTTGTLLSEAVFTGGSEVVNSGNVIEVQYVFLGSDDGV